MFKHDYKRNTVAIVSFDTPEDLHKALVELEQEILLYPQENNCIAFGNEQGNWMWDYDDMTQPVPAVDFEITSVARLLDWYDSIRKE